jgi:hypothetical protein
VELAADLLDAGLLHATSPLAVAMRAWTSACCWAMRAPRRDWASATRRSFSLAAICICDSRVASSALRVLFQRNSAAWAWLLASAMRASRRIAAERWRPMASR